MEIGLVGAELFYANEQTDMRNPLVEFRNFVNGPKNSKFYPHSIFKRIVKFLLWTAFISLHSIYRLIWRHCGYYDVWYEFYVHFKSTFSFKLTEFHKISYEVVIFNVTLSRNFLSQ
jgi:hypothetical protein